MAPYLIACSMQHVLTVSTYPGSCKSCFSHIPVFGGKVSLIFPIIYQTVDLKLICIIGQPDLINPLILPISTLNDIFTHFGGFFSIFTGQLALKFHWDKTCFFLACIDSVNITNYIEITWLLDQSCQNQSFWWLCRRLTRSTNPWLIKYGPSISN